MTAGAVICSSLDLRDRDAGSADAGGRRAAPARLSTPRASWGRRGFSPETRSRRPLTALEAGPRGPPSGPGSRSPTPRSTPRSTGRSSSGGRDRGLSSRPATRWRASSSSIRSWSWVMSPSTIVARLMMTVGGLARLVSGRTVRAACATSAAEAAAADPHLRAWLLEVRQSRPLRLPAGLSASLHGPRARTAPSGAGLGAGRSTMPAGSAVTAGSATTMAWPSIRP